MGIASCGGTAAWMGTPGYVCCGIVDRLLLKTAAKAWAYGSGQEATWSADNARSWSLGATTAANVAAMVARRRDQDLGAFSWHYA